MESPLDVLSRAASIVQKEGSPKPIKTTGRSSLSESESDDETKHIIPTPPLSPDESISRERRSPKRQHSITERSLKKLKLEDQDDTYHRTSPKTFHVHPISTPITSTTYTYDRTPITVPTEQRRTYSRTTAKGSSPPPLISIHETRKNRSTLPAYESLFPRPSVISSSPPSGIYLDYCRKDCSCRDCNRSFTNQSKYPQFLKKSSNISSVITRDFDLPTVDDHFRKSLGDKYNIPDDFSPFNERPSSVDDHFAKALGTKWYSLEYGRCASS